MQKTVHTLIEGDSRRVGSLADGSVHLVVTSPPYPMIKMWDKLFSKLDPGIEKIIEKDPETAFEKMHIQLDRCWREAGRVLIRGGIACVNVGDATRSVGGEFRLFNSHSRITRAFHELGFVQLPSIVWRKQTNSPNKFLGSGMSPPGAYVTLEHEHILIFRKGGRRSFAGAEKARRSESAFFWEERNLWFSDLWTDIRGARQAGEDGKRTAAFPFEIAQRLVNMFSIKGDTVLDPFAGTGTTAMACMASERNSISVDIDGKILEISGARLMRSKGELNGLIETRLGRHLEFITGKGSLSKYENEAHGFRVKTRQEIGLIIRKIGKIEIGKDGNIGCFYK